MLVATHGTLQKFTIVATQANSQASLAEIGNIAESFHALAVSPGAIGFVYCILESTPVVTAVSRIKWQGYD